MGYCDEPNNLELTNSQKAERFFAGLNSYVGSNHDRSQQSTGQPFGASQVLVQTTLVHDHADDADQTIDTAINGGEESDQAGTRAGSEKKYTEEHETHDSPYGGHSDHKPSRDHDNGERNDMSRFYSNQIYNSYEAYETNEEKVTGDFSNNASQFPDRSQEHMQSYADTYGCQQADDLYFNTDNESANPRHESSNEVY